MATMSNNDRDMAQPICQNCTTSTTPLWRRDEIGSVLCNACGLFLKLHGRPRPISLKTDVIKSRNRVKTSGPGQGQKKKVCLLNTSMESPGVSKRANLLIRASLTHRTDLATRDRKPTLLPRLDSAAIVAHPTNRKMAIPTGRTPQYREPGLHPCMEIAWRHSMGPTLPITSFIRLRYHRCISAPHRPADPSHP